MQCGGRQWPAGVALLLALLAPACNSPTQPVYQDKLGFRFTPPAGWVERARDDALPAPVKHRSQDLPLPRLAASAKAQERLLVQYYRPISGSQAWLRVTIADLPTPATWKEFLPSKGPGPGWKRESEDTVEVGGQGAARIAFAGRWNNQEYITETVAVPRGANVYILTASFPASDIAARTEVREAIARASWPQ